MAKIKIAQSPTFKAQVLVPIVGAAPESVEFTFKYRDRKELAALFDEWNESAKAMREGLGSDPSLTDIVVAETSRQCQQIKDLVIDWSFDDEFNSESIEALVKSCQGAPQAVIDAYQGAFSQARLGN